MKFVENPNLLDRVQVRRHKKKRINKKWMKIYGFKGIPSKKIIVFGGNVFGHPQLLKLIKLLMGDK